MEFRIADTFTDSLARLTGEEQKAVKTAAFDLQLNPAGPSMSFHKLAKAASARQTAAAVASSRTLGPRIRKLPNEWHHDQECRRN